MNITGGGIFSNSTSYATTIAIGSSNAVTSTINSSVIERAYKKSVTVGRALEFIGNNCTTIGIGVGVDICAGNNSTVIGSRVCKFPRCNECCTDSEHYKIRDWDLSDKPNSFIIDNADHIFIRNSDGTEIIDLKSKLEEKNDKLVKEVANLTTAIGTFEFNMVTMMEEITQLREEIKQMKEERD